MFANICDIGTLFMVNHKHVCVCVCHSVNSAIISVSIQQVRTHIPPASFVIDHDKCSILMELINMAKNRNTY